MEQEMKYKLYKDLGETIRTLRLARGMTLNEVGEKFSRQRAWLHGVENGKQQLYLHDYIGLMELFGLPDATQLNKKPIKLEKLKVNKKNVEELFNVKIV
jgi:transcriptional regulator with XRE-family HTH domain